MASVARILAVGSTLIAATYFLTVVPDNTPPSAARVALTGACCGFEMFPVLLALVAVWITAPGLRAHARKAQIHAWTAIAAFAGVVNTFALVLTAWAGDWGNIKTGSSTSGVLILLFPLPVLIGGLVAGLIGAIVSAALQTKCASSSA